LPGGVGRIDPGRNRLVVEGGMKRGQDEGKKRNERLIHREI